jgi:hypothetical protein
MEKIMANKKGIALAQLTTVALLFVLLTITLAIGAYINAQVNSTANWAATTTQSQIVANGTAGIANLGQWLPIIAIVIAAGVIIATLVGAFAFRRGGV